MATSERNEAGTPQHLYDALDAEYRFNFDVCASEENAKCSKFWTLKDDCLKRSWARKRVWCNPPYLTIPPFLLHALEPVLAVYLLPARTDRQWWRRWKPYAEVHYFVGEAPHKRIQYVPPRGICYSSNPYCEVLFGFGHGFRPGFEVWRSGLTGERL